ncbi:hypothetical protein [Planotetraspora kaengkrachanensis]|uniref:Uncharacterized protein n=1 Tax=Planotetraspora kaengkrachanensis TaxID=575193 RepID=A0A8J3Q1S4_9ACTN|nr:hypothetical protein [Planotetraspora kaengkrachanensis]GIG85023.1 hypothetical protein Pka01_81500 [Planotetraspora kaengkrachanensis]
MGIGRPHITRRRNGAPPGRRRHRRTGALLAILALIASMFPALPAAADPLPYGPYTCDIGAVWREATAKDPVCVLVDRRTEVRDQNALAPSRTLPNGNCKDGFVWRLANWSDHTCATPRDRSKTAVDNESAYQWLVDPTATPRGGISVIQVPNHEGEYDGFDLYAMGTNITPTAKVAILGDAVIAWPPTHKWGSKWITYHWYRVGSLQVYFNGEVGDEWVHLGRHNCSPLQTDPVTLIAVDYGSGVVTTVGTVDWKCPS